MKNKILFIIFAVLLSSPIFAFDWGVFSDYEENYQQNYILRKFINNEPIKYYAYEQFEINPSEDENNNNNADLKTTLNNALNTEQRKNELKSLVIQAFNAWPQHTKNMIEKDNRTKEFDDIVKQYLSKPLNLVYGEEKADIFIAFTTMEIVKNICGEDATACFSTKNRLLLLESPFIETEESYEVRKDIALFILMHELGHYFGLADQYEDCGDISPKHSTPNRIGYYDSVMAAIYKPFLTCDDVDGFINLIDITVSLENNGEFSQRAKKGWASFCNGKLNGDNKYYTYEFYKEAQPITKLEYAISYQKYHPEPAENITKQK